MSIFHLAFPVDNLAKAKAFYCEGLGAKLGRQSELAIILNFFGHQIVAHKVDGPVETPNSIYPRHFGLVCETEQEWDNVYSLAKDNELEFYQEPRTRHPGEVTEHKTFFLKDPACNLLEFKFYTNESAIFSEHSAISLGDQ